MRACQNHDSGNLIVGGCFVKKRSHNNLLSTSFFIFFQIMKGIVVLIVALSRPLMFKPQDFLVSLRPPGKLVHN